MVSFFLKKIMENSTTICAIASSLTPQSIGIIRISGSNSINIISKIFFDKNKKPIAIKTSHLALFGYIYDNDMLVDEVIVLPMLKPRSYTKEDVIEIQSHGSISVLQWIFQLLIKNGATLAEPGEFTKRAFLNGRIDLSSAEAVIDIINSKTKLATTAAANQIKGDIKNKINSLRNELLDAISFIEASLDDPEHLSVDGFKENLKKIILSQKTIVIQLINSFENGKILREGINTAIIGKPNVGKSSLLNLFLGEDRAIVSDIAGTTRDIIKENINFHGISLNIIDTAGIREDLENIDIIEKIGIDKSKQTATNCDLILFVIDVTTHKEKENFEVLKFLKSFDKPFIIILNKTDIKHIDKKFFDVFPKDLCIPFSAKTGFGLDQLKEKIKTLFSIGQINMNTEIIISNERHIFCLKNVLNSLSNVEKSILNKLPEDFWTIDLTDAFKNYSNILGEEINDDIINNIFSKFCVGK